MRITYFAKIMIAGNSHVIRIPKEIRTITETKRGDLVRIEIERVEENGNLHDDSTAR